MPGIKNELVETLWFGKDPFTAFPDGLFQADAQGWNENHPYLREGIDDLRPKIVVEVGVWKGSSSIVMAKRMKDLRIDGAVIAVDTWLGAVDHWAHENWFSSLVVEHGQPMLMRTFMTNVVKSEVSDYIVPLPLDSINAAELLKLRQVQVDMVHIDAGHEYESVISDLKAWWPLVRPGGLLVGDDYYDNDRDWPGLKRAFHEFFSNAGIECPLENTSAKCRVRKPI
ncbi:MAG: class I SAM-dependent methyltransferase [Methylorubrum populi]